MGGFVPAVSNKLYYTRDEPHFACYRSPTWRLMFVVNLILNLSTYGLGGRSRGRVWGSGPPYSTWQLFLWMKFIHWQDNNQLLTGQFFWMNRMLYFPTKLNSWDNWKCNVIVFGYPPMICDLIWENLHWQYFLKWLVYKLSVRYLLDNSMKIVRGIRQFVSNSSVSVRALVVSNRGVSEFVSNSCISLRALVQETKASTDDSIAI